MTVEIKSRIVTVTGPLGSLRRSFKHMALDLRITDDKKNVVVDIWFGNREAIASIR